MAIQLEESPSHDSESAAAKPVNRGHLIFVNWNGYRVTKQPNIASIRKSDVILSVI